jgi:predicted TIM-barrel fold metal-dependent hydrolase
VLDALRSAKQWRVRGPRLGAYAPQTTLSLPAHTPERALVPAIDFHTHLGRWLTAGGGWMEPDPLSLVRRMDECNVISLVNLDGLWGDELEENLDRYDRAWPGRFFTFCHLDWRLLERRNGSDLLVKSLEQSVRQGARGLKVWKDLGMGVTAGGRPVLPDDPRLDPVWEAAGHLGIPVLIHVADPVAFFQPINNHNERLEELLRHPSDSRAAGGLAEFARLMSALEHLVAGHPSTNIVGAHGGCFVENLAWVAGLLDAYPNYFIDVAGRAAELGRQPRTARSLIEDHPDRVLFGTDVFPSSSSGYRTYFRLLETADEAFPYSDEPVPSKGRWSIYGLALSETALARLYQANAARLLGLTQPGATSMPRS